MVKDRQYYCKIGADKIPVNLEEVTRVIDASNLDMKTGVVQVGRHDVAECIFKLDQSASFDLAETISATGRFVIVDGYDIAGGGIILEELEDQQSWVRGQVLERNFKWEKSYVSRDERTEKYGHEPALILVTGPKDGKRKEFAKELERNLFSSGHKPYYLGMANVLYGIDADIKDEEKLHNEQFRRLAEVAHLMLKAGLIVIITAQEMTQEDVDLIAEIVDHERMKTVWVGNLESIDIKHDLNVIDNVDEAINYISTELSFRSE